MWINPKFHEYFYSISAKPSYSDLYFYMATVTKKRKRAAPILQFEDLPAEIDIKVMSYLDITDLINSIVKENQSTGSRWIIMAKSISYLETSIIFFFAICVEK